MNQQMALPCIPRTPGWWVSLLPEYLFQPVHSARAKVVGRRYRPRIETSHGGGYVGTVRVTIKEAWLLKVRTPHGTVEIEVSERFHDLTRKGDVIRASYRLSRLYDRDQKIDAKLLK